MFRDRGIFEVPSIGPTRRYQARTSKGAIAFELTLSLASVSPQAESLLVARLEKWLGQIDPQLRVIPAGPGER